MPELHDLLIVGGGPAGAAAALRARQLGLDVVILDKHTFPRARACTGWIGPHGVALSGECGLTARKAGATEFSAITLHSWDFKRRAQIKDPSFRGWLVDRSAFDHALLKCAQKAGAVARLATDCTGLRLGETSASVLTGSAGEFAARVVFVADGSGSEIMRISGVTGVAATSAHAALVDCESAVSESGIEVVLGARRVTHLATLVRIGKTARVSLLTRDASAPAAEQLGELIAGGRGALRLGDALGKIIGAPSVAGAALDIESHVGKRTLLIGDAGGFVSAFSHEGVYPAMKSGWIAAQVAARALQAPLLQDELAGFGAAWRVELAEYLRMPNTDLSLLAPLVFSNAQMSKRVAAAFLLGQGF
ncbi:2-octaprenyl-6-methoxyphenyl hydroxylase [Phycisphaerae bacterium RAS1]|nr:2-octaprenyl-6-methoxyphenyl hydroxylase [Phycisphaerae bacterium RAS1]